MSKLFSKSHRERKTGAESPNIPAPNSLAVSQSISASSSTILEHLPMETPKKGILSYFKGRSKLGTGSKKQSAGGTIAYSSIKRHDIAPDEADIPIQPDTLLIERVNLNLPEDSNYQRKLDILDTSMEVLGLFEEVSKAASLVVPDALGLVLKGTAAILGRLKKMVENKQAWRELLLFIDGRQKAFNTQLAAVKDHNLLPPELLDPVRQYTEALKSLAAKVMDQVGLVGTDSPTDNRFLKIKEFTSKFLDTNSDAQGISDYKAQLIVAIDELKDALTLYIAVTVTRIDRKTDHLKALIFLEGGNGTPDKTTFGTKHKKCLKDTRIDVLDDIRNWDRKSDCEKPVYCIGDVAGTGKSTIMRTLVDEWKAEEYLSFFFSETAKHDARTLCISVAKQIISFCDGPNWDDYWSNLSSDLSSPRSQGTESLWKKLVQKPLESCIKHRRHILVVDALDECDTETRGELFDYMLDACSSKSNPPLRLLITTRNEPDLLVPLRKDAYSKSVIHKTIRHSTNAQDDVSLYVKSTLVLGEVTLTASDQEKLIKRSEGLFIFASMACTLLKDAYLLEQSLEDILNNFTSLDSLYHQVLVRAAGVSSSEITQKSTQDALRKILSIIVVACEAPSITVINSLLLASGTRINATKFIKNLGSTLASGSPDDPVYILHATFKEFLLRKNLIERDGDHRENGFAVDNTESNRVVAKACVEIMSKELKFNICQLETSFLSNRDIDDLQQRVRQKISAGLQYSCVYWASHLCLDWDQNSEEASNDLDRLFMDERPLYWLEVMSLMGKVPLAISALRNVTAHTATRKGLHPDIAYDLLRFVLAFSTPISVSAPHIYLSTLPFIPTESVLWKRTKNIFRNLLQVEKGRMKAWPTRPNAWRGHTDSVLSIAYSLDGQHLVSSSEDKTIRIWDTMTGLPVGEPLMGHTDGIGSVSYSPDGQYVVSGSHDKTIRIWDSKTGEPVGEPLMGHTGPIMSVACSPDGQQIASGSDDGTIRIWDAKTGAILGEPLIGHEGTIWSVAYSPDGQQIASGSNDSTIRIWDAKTGVPVGEPLIGHTNGIWSVIYSPDGQYIFSGSVDWTLRIWDAKTKEPVGEPLMGHTGSIGSVTCSSDGRSIITSSTDQTIRIWDVKTRAPVGEPLLGHTDYISSVIYSPDGQHIVSGSVDKTIRIWDAKTREPVGESLMGHTGSIWSVAYSPDGRHVVSGSMDKTVRIWDAEIGAPVGDSLIGHKGTIWIVAYSPNGQHIASGSDDKTIRIWDAKTGAPVGKPFMGHTGFIKSVAYSSDGQHIVSGSSDMTIRIWDAKTGACIGGPLTGHTEYISSVMYLPDGHHLISGSPDGTIRIWDSKTRLPVGEPLMGHTDSIWSITYSPDGQYIASGSGDKTIRIWDAKTGELVGDPLVGHTGAIWSVMYSLDGHYIFSGSVDKTIRIWDATKRRPVGEPLEGHTNAVTSISYSQDGRYIVSGSLDETIRIWNVAKDKDGSPNITTVSNAQPTHLHQDVSSMLDELSMMTHSGFPIPKRLVDSNGWVCIENKLIFWVPGNYRNGLITDTVVTIPTTGPSRIVRIDFSHFRCGNSWTEVYEQSQAS